jgi:hypothetical protein
MPRQKRDKVSENYLKEFWKRFDEFFKSQNVAMVDVSSAIGNSSSYLNQMRLRKGALGVPTIYQILTLYPALNPDWLILGKGTMIRGILPQDTNEFMKKVRAEQELKKKISEIEKIHEEIKDLQVFLNADAPTPAKRKTMPKNK